jgi:hypothetical protein
MVLFAASKATASGPDTGTVIFFLVCAAFVLGWGWLMLTNAAFRQAWLGYLSSKKQAQAEKWKAANAGIGIARKLKGW